MGVGRLSNSTKAAMGLVSKRLRVVAKLSTYCGQTAIAARVYWLNPPYIFPFHLQISETSI
jgi:hypothetical protein